MFQTSNVSYLTEEDFLDVNTDIYSKVLVTVIYAVLFTVGCLGNSVTLYIMCKKDSSQNLQSTVHYHLASLAASDLLILILCMPVELYNFIWIHHPWAFGDVVCRSYYFLRDGCSYATALNIASLSVERYMAICHPFKAKRVMSRGRTRKLICGLWVVSLFLASSMLFIMGQHNVGLEMICTPIVSTATVKTVLQVNALLSFVVPMAVVSILNWLIGRQLQRLSQQALLHHSRSPLASSDATEPARARSLRHGVAVLRVVVIAFVVCWLPYHIRRLLFCYIIEWTERLYDFYHYFYMVTNVLFYVSSAINPVLYNLVSADYRELFFSTLSSSCLRGFKKREGARQGNGLHHLQQLPSSVQQNPLPTEQTALSFTVTNENLS
ncbi:neurotensin receptor type 1-like [Clupea harengus]|uniref:Neurotensin receptor type 1-like n=1 Tax=Clupea harengus TaxID=7950 RepID=A0A6P3VN21_CLUHA|nr:neurotensin receptor type 1-like [Clupea harengus]